jgi:hypothetical protein
VFAALLARLSPKPGPLPNEDETYFALVSLNLARFRRRNIDPGFEFCGEMEAAGELSLVAADEGVATA